MSMMQPNCSKRRCLHFQGVRYLEEGKEETEVVYCSAFPNGIPDDISYGDNEHSKPVKAQGNNIVYEQKAPGEE